MNGDHERTSWFNHRPTNVSTRVTVIMLGVCVGAALFAYAAFAATLVGPSNHQATVQQTILVFRHGDRTPTETYPNDPYRNHSWPGGWGALTKEGMSRMYKIGQWIRDEYGATIGSKYASDLSLTQSSYADRCIMSAQALLAGLYPTATVDMFVPGLPWRPVPVHSTPRNLDKTIVVKAPCPRLEEALREAYANESRNRETPSPEYYRELSKFTGQNVTTITDIEFLYNTLEIEDRSGLELPAWTEKYYNRQMREIAARSLAIFTSNKLQRRLRGGPLLKEILGHLQAFKNGTDTRRAYLYSVHDITLVNLLRTMGFTSEYYKPDYSATLVLELHFVPLTEDAEVKMVYVNETDTIKSYPLEIPNCAKPCLLTDLTQLWKDVLPDNWDEECKL